MKKIAIWLALAASLIAPSAAYAQVCPAVAALPDTERRVSYAITASTGPLSVTFPILGDSTDYGAWVEVWINGVLKTPVTDWTLSIPSGSLSTACRPITTATISFTAAQTGTVQIVGARRPRRTSQFPENAGVSARNLNQVITDLTAQNRETWDKTNDITGRGFFAPPGQTGAIITGVFPGVISAPSSVGDGNFAVWNGTSGAALKDGGVPPFVNVTSAPYNAVANCSTDNSAAFTAAIAAAAIANKALYIPGAALCYRYSTTLTMTTLVPIFGDGMDQSVLEYTGAGVGLLIQPAANFSSAAEFRGHFLKDFTIKPSVIGAGTYGIRVQPLVAAGFYAQFVWDHIRVGEFGTYSAYLDNTAGLLSGGFFVGSLRTVQFGNSMIGEAIGDTISISEDSKIHGSKALAFSMVAGARGLVITDSSLTTSGGFSCAPCNGVRIERNHIEDFQGFNGGNNAQLSFTDSTQITIRENRIATVAGTKPNDTILFLGTTTNAFVDELELAKGNNTHIRSTVGTSNITIGSNISVDAAPLVIQLAGATNPGKWIDYTNATAVGNANYQVLCTDRVIHTGAALTANRTITLPASADCPDGLNLEFRDAAGAFGTFGWVITRSGADTIFGGATFTINKQLASLNLRLIKASGLWVYPVTQAGQGGTGLNAGTSGGIPCFNSTTSMASSVLQTANAIMLGAGAAACPTPLGSLGTTTTVLHGNAAGAPTFGAVSLTADVSGLLPIANGGCASATGCIAVVKQQKFTGSGTYTPSTGLKYAIIECVGSGGGGAGSLGGATATTSGGGGGGGGYSRTVASAATIGASQTVTVGAVGNGGATGANNGTAGSDVSVGTICIGKGGGGGIQNGPGVAGQGGAAGVAGTGDITFPGSAGTNGVGGSIATITGQGGQGGASKLGGQCQVATIAASAGNGGAGLVYGGGGCGGAVNASASTASGGAGALGIVFITEFTNQ